jgi:hypothetical protein
MRSRRCICQGRAGHVLMFGEVSATIVLGACGRRGPQACVTEARALQLNAKSVRPSEERDAGSLY